MEPTIKQLILKRYRSIPAERITFDNPTIFVGRNGSGKSNLVSVFSFLAEAMAAPLQAVFDRAGGISAVRNRPSGSSHPPNFGLRVDLGSMNGRSKGGFYAFEVRALPNYGFAVVREQCSVTGETGSSFSIAAHRRSSSLRSRITRFPISLIWRTSGGPYLG